MSDEIAKLFELEKDAARYRYLRSPKTGKEINCIISGVFAAWLNSGELDSAIDAELAKGK